VRLESAILHSCAILELVLQGRIFIQDGDVSNNINLCCHLKLVTNFIE
jgi:hypothetical protein